MLHFCACNSERIVHREHLPLLSEGNQAAERALSDSINCSASDGTVGERQGALMSLGRKSTRHRSNCSQLAPQAVAKRCCDQILLVSEEQLSVAVLWEQFRVMLRTFKP